MTNCYCKAKVYHLFVALSEMTAPDTGHEDIIPDQQERLWADYHSAL